MTSTKPSSPIAAGTTAPARRSVLILGANGRFGLVAAQAFVAAGWQVLAQVRRTAAPGLPAGARLLTLPLHDIDALARASAGASVVVHAVNPVYTRWAQDLLPMARAGMDIAERLGARFVLPGNVYDFGSAMPPVLTEHTPSRPDTPHGKLRVQLAQEMRRRAPRLRSLVIRAGDFYGSGRGTWFDQAMLKSLADGKIVYPGPLDRVHAWAYLPDLARATVALCESPALGDLETVHFVGDALTGQALVAAIESAARAAGLAPARGFRVGAMPWGVIRVVGMFVPLWRALARMSYLWRVPHQLQGDRFAALAPGFVATPLPEKLRASLQAMGLGDTAQPARLDARPA